MSPISETFSSQPISDHGSDHLPRQQNSLIPNPNPNFHDPSIPSLLHVVFNEYEGATLEDGRTPSIWDTYAHAGYMQGDTGDTANDGYQKYKSMQHGMVEINLYAIGFSRYTNATGDVLATKRSDDFFFGWFMDSLVFGDYPDIMKKNVGIRLPALVNPDRKN